MTLRSDPRRRRRLPWAAFAVVPLFTLIVGCSSDTTPAEAPSRTATTPTGTAPQDGGELAGITKDQFLEWVGANTENANLLSEEMILDTAQMTCDTLDGGDSYLSVMNALMDLDVDDEQRKGLGGVSVAAVEAFCPECFDETFGTTQ